MNLMKSLRCAKYWLTASFPVAPLIRSSSSKLYSELGGFGESVHPRDETLIVIPAKFHVQAASR